MDKLEDLPVAVDLAAIESAMRPFLLSEGEELRWRSEVGRRWASTLARLVTGREAARDREANASTRTPGAPATNAIGSDAAT